MPGTPKNQKIKLSNAFVADTNEAGTYRDTGLRGFCLKVTGTGSKVYFVNAKVRGTRKNVTITIGKHGTFTPKSARIEAESILRQLALGVNPNETKRCEVAEKAEANREAKAAQRVLEITLETALADYLRVRKLKQSTAYIYRCVVSSKLSDWLPLPLIHITKDMVERRHQQISQNHPGDADHAMRVLRAVFFYAALSYEDHKGQPLVTSNPVRRLSEIKIWNKPARRQTVIKRHELKKWYEAVRQVGQATVQDYLLFLLFTGLRASEAAQLRWSDVDLVGQTISISDTKNHMPHMLPLSDYLLELLQARSQSAESEYVFPALDGKGCLKDVRYYVSGWRSGPQKRPNPTAIEQISGIKFILHDLRRTFLTIAESLDTPHYALKRLANHKTTSDVTSGYIVADVERLRVPMQRITNAICHYTGIKVDARLDGTNVYSFGREPAPIVESVVE
jgi:integrase